MRPSGARLRQGVASKTRLRQDGIRRKRAHDPCFSSALLAGFRSERHGAGIGAVCGKGAARTSFLPVFTSPRLPVSPSPRLHVSPSSRLHAPLPPQRQAPEVPSSIPGAGRRNRLRTSCTNMRQGRPAARNRWNFCRDGWAHPRRRKVPSPLFGEESGAMTAMRAHVSRASRSNPGQRFVTPSRSVLPLAPSRSKLELEALGRAGCRPGCVHLAPPRRGATEGPSTKTSIRKCDGQRDWLRMQQSRARGISRGANGLTW